MDGTHHSSKKHRKESPPVTTHQPRSRTNTLAKKAAATATMASRMPNVLPREDTKIVVRPWGGLCIVKTPVTVMAAANIQRPIFREKKWRVTHS